MWFVHVLQGKSELQEAQALLVELNSETRWPQGGASSGGSGGWGVAIRAAWRAGGGGDAAFDPAAPGMHQMPCELAADACMPCAYTSK